MRAHRVRFTPPKKIRDTKRRFGNETFLHSPAGWQAKLERLAEQIREQNGLCPCGEKLIIGEARFRSKIFRENEVNPAICPKCAKTPS
jgi:hypothetical protein